MMDTTEKMLTLEDVKAKFCVTDKQATLEQMLEQLNSAWDIDATAKFADQFIDRKNKEIEEAGVDWTRYKRTL